jgi:uncharacterized membrane protein YagU involved in acid resistance
MIKQVLKATLLAGTLDICAAFIQAYSTHKIPPLTILKYIAGGVFGKEAFTGGYHMAAFGLLFHFIIAFACALIFFLLYPKLKFLKYSVVLNSVLIALVAWAVTNFIIMPLSKLPKGNFDLSRAAIAVAILFVCIGLPLALMAKRYYAVRKFRQ